MQPSFLYIVGGASAIYEEFPETPSHFVLETKLLPERSYSVKTTKEFHDYIPVACFCDRDKCNANVKSIQSPVIGLLRGDGKIVQSLEIKASQGQLMYILLIDSKSIVANGAYFERTSYWQLADGQHQLLPGVPFDYEISPQVSVSILKQSNSKFYFGSETKNITIPALEMSTGLSMSAAKESEDKTTYRYLSSEVNRAIGIYQLIHELVIYPSQSLALYIANQITGAQCTSFLIIKQNCGFLLALPSLIQRTPIFRQVAVDLEVKSITGSSSDRNSDDSQRSRKMTESNQTSKIRVLSRRIIMIIIISASTAAVSLVVVVLVLWRYNPCPSIPPGHEPILGDDDDDNQELVMMSEKQAESVLPVI